MRDGPTENIELFWLESCVVSFATVGEFSLLFFQHWNSLFQTFYQGLLIVSLYFDCICIILFSLHCFQSTIYMPFEICEVCYQILDGILHVWIISLSSSCVDIIADTYFLWLVIVFPVRNLFVYLDWSDKVPFACCKPVAVVGLSQPNLFSHSWAMFSRYWRLCFLFTVRMASLLITCSTKESLFWSEFSSEFAIFNVSTANHVRLPTCNSTILNEVTNNTYTHLQEGQLELLARLVGQCKSQGWGQGKYFFWMLDRLSKSEQGMVLARFHEVVKEKQFIANTDQCEYNSWPFQCQRC